MHYNQPGAERERAEFTGGNTNATKHHKGVAPAPKTVTASNKAAKKQRTVTRTKHEIW